MGISAEKDGEVSHHQDHEGLTWTDETMTELATRSVEMDTDAKEIPRSPTDRRKEPVRWKRPRETNLRTGERVYEERRKQGERRREL